MSKLILLFVLSSTVVGSTLSIICPDARYRCPNTSTCCKTSSGYGCCPYVDATCCSDELHCCPNHLICDVEKSQCISRMGVAYPFQNPVKVWSEILDARELTVELEANTQVVCSGNQSCPDHYTCCTMPGGDIGCCPEDHGVCCSDGVHCCPHSTVCNLEKGTCEKQ